MSKLIRLEAAAAIADMSARTLARRLREGSAPNPIRVGSVLMFREDEMKDWAMQRRGRRQANHLIAA